MKYGAEVNIISCLNVIYLKSTLPFGLFHLKFLITFSKADLPRGVSTRTAL